MSFVVADEISIVISYVLYEQQITKHDGNKI